MISGEFFVNKPSLHRKQHIDYINYSEQKGCKRIGHQYNDVLAKLVENRTLSPVFFNEAYELSFPEFVQGFLPGDKKAPNSFYFSHIRKNTTACDYTLENLITFGVSKDENGKWSAHMKYLDTWFDSRKSQPISWQQALIDLFAKHSFVEPEFADVNKLWKGKYPLRDYQKEVVQMVLRERGGLVFHETGTGKSFSALASIQAFFHALEGDAVFVFSDTKPLHQLKEDAKSLLSPKDYGRCVWKSYSANDINSDKYKSWLKSHVGKRNYLVICDECHLIKNVDGTRGSTVRTLVRGARRVLYMSATPIDKYPSEISHVVNAMYQCCVLDEESRFLRWNMFTRTRVGNKYREKPNLQNSFKELLHVLLRGKISIAGVSEDNFPRLDYKVVPAILDQDHFDAVEATLPAKAREEEYDDDDQDLDAIGMTEFAGGDEDESFVSMKDSPAYLKPRKLLDGIVLRGKNYSVKDPSCDEDECEKVPKMDKVEEILTSAKYAYTDENGTTIPRSQIIYFDFVNSKGSDGKLQYGSMELYLERLLEDGEQIFGHNDMTICVIKGGRSKRTGEQQEASEALIYNLFDPKLAHKNETIKSAFNRSSKRMSVNEAVAESQFGNKEQIDIYLINVKQGLDFKNVENLIILGTQFSLADRQQIVGRGVRFNSHVNLPQKLRVVHAHQILSVGPGGKETIDQKIYRGVCNRTKYIECILDEMTSIAKFNKPENKRQIASLYKRFCNNIDYSSYIKKYLRDKKKLEKQKVRTSADQLKIAKRMERLKNRHQLASEKDRKRAERAVKRTILYLKKMNNAIKREERNLFKAKEKARIALKKQRVQERLKEADERREYKRKKREEKERIKLEKKDIKMKKRIAKEKAKQKHLARASTIFKKPRGRAPKGMKWVYGKGWIPE